MFTSIFMYLIVLNMNLVGIKNPFYDIRVKETRIFKIKIIISSL